VQVVEGGQNRGGLGKVPIVARTFLPVTKRRPTTIARKRQFVDVVGVVIMPYSFSMPRTLFHADHPIHSRHCWTSQQWHPRVAIETRIMP
jgi:hypothetical protein